MGGDLRRTTTNWLLLPLLEPETVVLEAEILNTLIYFGHLLERL
jgi:hypothetical protein